MSYIIYDIFFHEYNSRNESEITNLVEKAMKTTIEVLFDNGFFDKYVNADEFLNDYLRCENNGRCRSSLNQ